MHARLHLNQINFPFPNSITIFQINFPIPTDNSIFPVTDL